MTPVDRLHAWSRWGTRRNFTENSEKDEHGTLSGQADRCGARGPRRARRGRLLPAEEGRGGRDVGEGIGRSPHHQRAGGHRQVQRHERREGGVRPREGGGEVDDHQARPRARQPDQRQADDRQPQGAQGDGSRRERRDGRHQEELRPRPRPRRPHRGVEGSRPEGGRHLRQAREPRRDGDGRRQAVRLRSEGLLGLALQPRAEGVA